MALILIVDDDAAMCDALDETVRALGHRPLVASSGTEALAALGKAPIGAVLLDLRMPGMDGLEVLRRIAERAAPPPVTVLTAHASAANTIEAMRLGAFDHLTKPIGRAELAEVAERECWPRGAAPGGDAAAEPAADVLVGSSEAMRAVQKTIGMLADSNATVLISGETGTGKEVVARAIHEHGRRGGQAVRRRELRRDPGGADRERAFRPCPRRLYRGDRRPRRRLSRGRQRDAVSRRNRRHGHRARRQSSCARCRSGWSSRSAANRCRSMFA